MKSSVVLLMAIHCHQPVGNFGFVFEEAYAKAYDPFLRVLERHPSVRLALHYSGPLLDWLAQYRPEFIARVRTLARRGQVELLASGYYEPVLPLIPEPDRQGQIAKMRSALRARFGADASGLWLTERVWEPDLPETLANAGIRYTMVDTNQFAAAKSWLPSHRQIQDEAFWDVLGCYTTEYAGSSVTLFPASKRLRYWMPFQQVERTIEFLRQLRGHAGSGQTGAPASITFADDGEKFGLWPNTYRWVYEEGWLDRFFSALERESEWLATSTFQDYLEQAGPDGSVYLPCGSYEEMLEWSGGHFRNFFTKYPEANAMYHKMLNVSERLRALKAQGSRLEARTKEKQPRASSLEPRAKKRAALLQQAEEALYAGQCNCAYWHGVFGGLYLSHLRRAVYERLIAAEQLVNQAEGTAPSVTTTDADGDGYDEGELKTADMGVVVDPSDGGTLTEWLLYTPRVNLLDTLSRRPEPYHEKLNAKAVAVVGAGAAQPSSIHDTLMTKEPNLADHLTYDDHRRTAFLDYGLQQMPSLQELARSSWTEQRVWASGAFHWDRRAPRRNARRDPLEVRLTRSLPQGGSIQKTVRLSTQKPILECGYALDGVEVPVVALEFNLSLRDARYLEKAGQLIDANRFEIREEALGVSLKLDIDPPATVMHFPIETVSESEEGLERTYQGLCLMCFWSPQPRSGSRRTERTNRAWAGSLRWTLASPV